MGKLTLRYFIEGSGRIDLQLRLLTGEGGLDREINSGEINRPGLALAGFFLTILLMKESRFLEKVKLLL